MATLVYVEYAIGGTKNSMAAWPDVAEREGILVRKGSALGIGDEAIGLEVLMTGHVTGLPDYEYYLIIYSKKKIEEDRATLLVNRFRNKLGTDVRCFRWTDTGPWVEI